MKIEIFENDKIIPKKNMKHSKKISFELKKDLSLNIIFFGFIHNLKGNKPLIEFAFDNVKYELIHGKES